MGSVLVANTLKFCVGLWKEVGTVPGMDIEFVAENYDVRARMYHGVSSNADASAAGQVEVGGEDQDEGLTAQDVATMRV